MQDIADALGDAGALISARARVGRSSWLVKAYALVTVSEGAARVRPIRRSTRQPPMLSAGERAALVARTDSTSMAL